MAAPKILAAGVGTCLIGGGSLYSYRQSLLVHRRGELAKEHSDLSAEVRNCEKRMKAVISQEKADFAKIEVRKRAVDILWGERLRRYVDTNEQLKSFIVALPEAMGVVNGLSNHYQYLADAAREYFAFDIWSSKSHNFALLLDACDSSGVVPVVEKLQGLFGSDELVEAVCANVLSTANMLAAPQSVADVNTAFTFCMEQLDLATLDAAERYEAELAALNAHKAPNVVVGGINRVLQWAKLSEVDQAAENARMSEESDRRRRFRQLTELDDIKHALRYVEDVSALIQKNNGTAAGVPSDNSVTPTKAPAIANFPEYALRDKAVVMAVQQLRVWEEGATAFLIQSQAKTVLKAYFDVMALPLTTIRDPVRPSGPKLPQ